MSDFEREQELTALFREALQAIRDDAKEAVGDAARGALPTTDDLEELVRRVVREELAGVASAQPAPRGAATGRAWVGPVAGVLAAVALLAAGWTVGRSWEPRTSTTAISDIAVDTISDADTTRDISAPEIPASDVPPGRAGESDGAETRGDPGSHDALEAPADSGSSPSGPRRPNGS